MDLKLTIYCEVEGRTKPFDLDFKKELITIGRHSRNDVQIPDMKVSTEHARILVEEGQPFLLDLGSAEGTRIDGTQVGPGVKTPLPMGSTIELATYRVVVSRPEQVLDESTSERTAMVAMDMVRDVLGSFAQTRESPFLEVLNDEEAGNRVEMDAEREYTIGRESSCDLVLRHWSISRKHAMVRRVGNDFTIMDLKSKNGVLLNGNLLSEGKHVKDGDTISVGHTELRFRDPAGNLLDSMDGLPTPITDLKDLGLDLSGGGLKDSPPRSTPPAPPVSTPPAREPSRPAARSEAPAGRPADTPPARRPLEPESSFTDNLPIIFGVVLLLGAVAAALFLFVL